MPKQENRMENVPAYQFAGRFMVKVLQTDESAAILRGGPGSIPFAGWTLAEIARRAQKPTTKDQPGKPSLKLKDWVRILAWPFEGFSARVVLVEPAKQRVLVHVRGNTHPFYLAPDEVEEIEAEFTENDRPAAAWYVLYGYAGHEEKLRDAIRRRLSEAGLLSWLVDIVVPTQGQDLIALVKEGKVHTISPSLFPGAVFVRMLLTDTVWEVVRQTPGLTGFVGIGSRPLAYLPAAPGLPHTQETGQQTHPQPGDEVRILSGPFYDFRGKVITVDEVNKKLTVMIHFFGRSTPVLVGFEQVE